MTLEEFREKAFGMILDMPEVKEYSNKFVQNGSNEMFLAEVIEHTDMAKQIIQNEGKLLIPECIDFINYTQGNHRTYDWSLESLNHKVNDVYKKDSDEDSAIDSVKTIDPYTEELLKIHEDHVDAVRKATKEVTEEFKQIFERTKEWWETEGKDITDRIENKENLVEIPHVIESSIKFNTWMDRANVWRKTNKLTSSSQTRAMSWWDNLEYNDRKEHISNYLACRAYKKGESFVEMIYRIEHAELK